MEMVKRQGCISLFLAVLLYLIGGNGEKLSLE